MEDYIDKVIRESFLDPIGKAYTDGASTFKEDAPSAEVSKSVNRLTDTFGTREESLGWELNVLGDDEKYNRYGMTRNKQTLEAFNKGTLDKQFAELQSAKEKLWNGVKQAAWSETVLGTLGSFGTLYDIVTGKVFRSDNDYQNAWSNYFEQLQEQYRENNKIYVDPDKAHSPSDAGWWASNLPSIMSSLTLLIPSTGVTRAVGGALKLAKVDKFARGTVKALTGARRYKTAEEAAEGLKGFSRWANTQSTITATNNMLEVGLNATLSRTLENYQEGRQVYNDMYNQAAEEFANMSDAEFADYLDRHEYIRNNVASEPGQSPRREDVARFIANQSANETFIDDYTNTIFDVAQLYALKNPLKLMRDMRTTTAVSKAQRLVKRYPNKTLQQIAELEAKRSIGRKIADFASDRYKNAAIIGAELSEGIEEGINYIAQQEGMHFGNLLLDRDNHTSFNDRLLQSYYNAPELYESAFWGVLGGVVFQAGGSALQNLQRGIAKKIDRARNKENAKTKEKVNKESWQDDFESPETKRRVADIEKRTDDFNTLVTRFNQIKNQEDPFHLNNDGTGNASLTSDAETDAAINRTIDEYVTSMTLRSLDSGNYKLLKEYLRDKNVRQAFIDAGIVEEQNADDFVDRTVTKMDEIERRYNDNLIALDNMSAYMESSIPIEYLQIIARDNVAAQMDIDDIQRRIDNYETSAANNERRYDINGDDSVRFKEASQLVVSARRLALLNAEQKEIEKDKDTAQSLAGQIRLNQIKQEKDAIYDFIWEDGGTYADSLTKLLWSVGIERQGSYDATGKFTLANTDDYIDFLDRITAREKSFTIGRREFKLTDEQIISMFGERGDEGSYAVLSQNLDRDFDILKNLDKEAKPLDNDYQTIAALKINKYIQQAKVATKASEIRNRVNELHNIMNAARAKAISDAYKVIYDAAKTYGYEAIQDYIFNNGTLTAQEGTDLASTEKVLQDALQVLNLTAASNEQLATNLNESLMLGAIRAAANSAGQELNLASENPSESSESVEVENPSSVTLNPATEPQNSEISQQEEAEPIEPEPNRLNVTLDLDNGISIETAAPGEDSENSFEYTINEDGSYTILFNRKNGIPAALVQNEDLFEGYDRNRDGLTFEKNPVVRKENGETIVLEKGLISYDGPVEETPAESAPAEVAAQESTISSTGGVESAITQPTPAEAAAAPAPTETTSQTEVDENYVDEEEVDRYIAILQEATEVFRNRDKSRDAAEVVEEIRQQLVENHKNEADQVSVAANINRAIESIRRRLERKGLLGSVNKVIEEMSSSVTEIKGHYDFGKAYKDAVNTLIDDYARRAKLPKINDKYYINLENILRDINTLYDDKTTANLLYNAMKEYLKTQEAKEKFVVTDDNVDDPHFIENVRKNSSERLREKIGNRDKYRVNIDDFFEHPTKAFLDAFNSIEKGDKLGVKVVDGGIILTKNGETIGNLPKPKVDKDTGNLYMWTKGWKTDVARVKGDDLISNLYGALSYILNSKPDINKLIDELNYGNLSEDEYKDKVFEAFKQLKQAVEEYKKANGITDDIIDKRAAREDVVDYIKNLWKYFNVQSLDDNVRTALRQESLDLWFEKICDSYSTIYSILNGTTNTDELEINVSNITSGEVVRVADITTSREEARKRNLDEQYDKFNYASEAIADIDNAKVGIVSPRDEKSIFTTDGTTVVHKENSGRGTVYVILRNKSGLNDYIVGTPVKMSDTKVTGTAKEIITEVKNQIEARINTLVANPSEDNAKELTNFLVRLFYTSGINAGHSKLPVNTGMFFGVRVSYVDRYGYTFGAGEGNFIQIQDNGTKFSYKDAQGTNHTLTIANNADTFRKLINNIVNKASFSIPINSINGNGTNGFASVQADESYVVSIPHTDGTFKTFEFDSYKDFILKGNIIKVNTAIDPTTKTNYRHKGNVQAANQVLEVEITRPTRETPPVGKIDDSQLTTSDVERILTDDAIEDKATEIAKLIFDEETLKALDKLHLLPKNVIFAEDLNEQRQDGTWRGDNARAELRSKRTLVGRRFIDMFNEVGEFVTDKEHAGTYRAQAIRKLIHEQLHHKLNANKANRRQLLNKIEEVYNDFKNYLDSNNVPADDHIREYLFANEDKDVALEEFLVESLTSEELANYLNSIEIESADTKTKNTVWQKILKLLADIFDWGVTEGSLYEKELKLLQSDIKKIETNAKQLEINFGAVEQQQAVEPVTETQDIESVDDIDINSLFDDSIDTRHSSVTEKDVRHPSVYSLLESIPASLQVKFNGFLERGDVSIACR